MSDESQGRAAIDLLLAAGQRVEKVHQAAWQALLQRSELLAELGLRTATPRKVSAEPNGGVFDLKVEAPGERVWIELKVDSGLGKAQVERGIRHAGGDQVIHALLGLANVRARPWTSKFAEERGSRVLGPSEVIPALRRVQASGDGEPGVRELARAYADQLEKLALRGADFRKSEVLKSVRAVYFYEQLRRACPEMKQAVIEYVSNPGGGFEACHWGWAKASKGVDCYLQWQDDELCIKVSVEDRSARTVVRDAALKFLRGHEHPRLKVEPSERLRSGRTMTMGMIMELPIWDESKWGELVAAMGDATRLVAALAKEISV